jgi:hypothetical protein
MQAAVKVFAATLTDVKGKNGLLKYCQWKGKEIPCSAIFTTFPTDKGMCCAFNLKAADEIFTGRTYSKLITDLQGQCYKTFYGRKLRMFVIS